MVGVAIGFASTTGFPAVANTERERGAQTMSLRGDAIRQAGANKAVRPPTGLGMRRPFLRKETGERKSYAIDRPFRSDFESIGLPLFYHFL